MKKAVMDHAMAAELESPEYTPAATRRLFMDSEVYCAVISVAVAHGVAKLLDKEERRKTITAKTQSMRDFFAEMAEGEMNEINGTPVLKMLDGQVNEEFGAWTPITTSLQGWVDLMKNIAQGLSTEAISELAEACRVSDSGLVTEELVERASAEFEAHVDHMCKMKYGEIDAGIEKTRAGWHEEKQEMETIMNARDNAPALPAIDGIINAAHRVLAGSKAPLCSEDVAKAINATKRATKLQIKEAEKQLKELFGLGILESNARAGGVSFYSLTVAPEPVPVNDDGCGACGDACASNGGDCRVKEESPPVCESVQAGGESQTGQSDDPVLHALGVMTRVASAARDLLHESEEFDFPDGLGRGAPQRLWDALGSEIEAAENDGAPIDDEMPPADPALLASANRMLSDRLEGVAHALRGCGLPALAEISGAEDLQMATAALSGAYQMAEAKIHDLETERTKSAYEFNDIGEVIAGYMPDPNGSSLIDGIRTMDMLIEAHRDYISTQKGRIANLSAIANSADSRINSLVSDVTNTRRALSDALNEADRMRSELAIERQARQALQEQINAAPAVAPLSYKVECSGLIYIKNASDRAIKEAERLAKLHGCPATITANVPFGTVRVVKGVEFKAAKAA